MSKIGLSCIGEIVNSMAASVSRASQNEETKSTSGRIKQAMTSFIKFGVAAGLIAWMVNKGALDFSLLLRLGHSPLLLPCMLTLFLNIFINNYRWVLLMRGQGFDLGIKETLPLSFIGLFFNYAMPGGVGGDLVKGYYILQDNPTRKTAAATSIIMDRLIGFVGMVMVSLLAIAINFEFILSKHELVMLSVGVLSLFVMFMLFFTVSFSSSIYQHPLIEKFLAKIPGGSKVKKIYEAVHSYKKSPREFLWACLLTVLTQVAAILFFYLTGAALGIEQAPLITYMFAVPLGLIATALPISPAGIGVGQAVFMTLFNWSLGYESKLGTSLITAHQIMTFILGLVGAYFYFKKKKPVMSDMNE